MHTINWTVENVRVNLPSISAEEYPITVPSCISADEVIANASKVNYCFCFDNVYSNSYKISNGKVVIDTADLSCELDGNTITVSEKESGGGSGGSADYVIHVTEDNQGNLVTEQTYAEAVEALNNGSTVYISYESYGGSTIYDLESIYPDEQSGSLTFVGVPYYDQNNNKFIKPNIIFYQDNTFYFDSTQIGLTVVMNIYAKEVSGNYVFQQKKAKALYDKLAIGNFAVKITYTNTSGQLINKYEYVTAFSKSGTNYTFSTPTKSFTASTDDGYPSAPTS